MVENFRFDCGYENDYDYNVLPLKSATASPIIINVQCFDNISYKRQLMQNKDKYWFEGKNLQNKNLVVALVS